ncbi:MAG: carbamoyltransferase [Candidatus Omnitrophica bacterium]|nr:carbamoyltransferase [Candidatus Omnitrophota bacterium]MCM8800208.1 carbamoyltransferase [Candidatus Omnitrophota bacterium]
MYILGISCFYHDSAACLIKDGEILYAVQEERFSRKKHDYNFPINSINWMLKQEGISSSDIDYVVFYEKPLVKFDRIINVFLSSVPLGIRSFMQAVPLWLKQKLWISDLIRKNINYRGKILFTTHHQAHASSAFFPSPFRESAILTLDGVGEWDTASFGIGKDNRIQILYTMQFPHSLGMLYSTFTYYCGFKVNSGEYKLMGLAPYGKPKYVDLILDKLIDLKEDGSFRLNLKYFGYWYGLKMTNRNFEKLFGGPPRRPQDRITQKYMDMASSIQKVTEEIMLRMAKFVYKVTGKDKLVLAGGVALNCVANGRILKEAPFKEIWIQPSSTDAGGALGSALAVWYEYLDNPRITDEKNDFQKGSFLGPSFSDKEIEEFLKRENIPYKKIDYSQIPDIVSNLVIQGKVIGWFEGRMEFGPRALGARSIIADPRDPQMQSRLNLKIKFRESFRPFAPTVLKEYLSEWFELNQESPYMLLVAPVKEDKREKLTTEEENLEGFDKLKVKRSQIPAVTHVDYSARLQTIKREIFPLYYDTINCFYKKTACPVIINTSFNVRGEPIVCSPQDAYRCFMRTQMDYLVMGSFLIDKTEQKQTPPDTSWQKVYTLD